MPTAMTIGRAHVSSQVGRFLHLGCFCLHLCCFLYSTSYRSLLQLCSYPYVLILICLMCRRRALSSPQSVRWRKEEHWHNKRDVLLPFFLHLPQNPDVLLGLNWYVFLSRTDTILDEELRLSKALRTMILRKQKLFLSIALIHISWIQAFWYASSRIHTRLSQPPFKLLPLSLVPQFTSLQKHCIEH